MKEHNKARLALIDARFSHNQAPGVEPDFDAAFIRVRDTVIRPVMQEVADELMSLGHSPKITTEELDHEGDVLSPCIALWPGQRGAGAVGGYVAFGVARTHTPKHVLAWLIVPPTPFDLERHAHPDDIRADYVEQCLVDAIEHLFSRTKTSG